MSATLRPRPQGEASSSDAVFLESVEEAVAAHLSDPSFNVAELAAALSMDRSHLYRRVKELTGVAPTSYLRGVHLAQAARLLAARAGTVSEIAYGVGFQSVPYFTTRFRKRYGCTPSQYKVTHKAADETHLPFSYITAQQDHNPL